jgi:hypothetical protein
VGCNEGLFGPRSSGYKGAGGRKTMANRGYVQQQRGIKRASWRSGWTTFSERPWHPCFYWFRGMSGEDTFYSIADEDSSKFCDYIYKHTPHTLPT